MVVKVRHVAAARARRRRRSGGASGALGHWHAWLPLLVNQLVTMANPGHFQVIFMASWQHTTVSSRCWVLITKPCIWSLLSLFDGFLYLITFRSFCTSVPWLLVTKTCIWPLSSHLVTHQDPAVASDLFTRDLQVKERGNWRLVLSRLHLTLRRAMIVSGYNGLCWEYKYVGTVREEEVPFWIIYVWGIESICNHLHDSLVSETVHIQYIHVKSTIMSVLLRSQLWPI